MTMPTQHNSRKVNKTIPKSVSECELESLLRVRNIFMPGGYLVGLDFASGYHCIGMEDASTDYLAFALHVSEIPAAAAARLMRDHSECFSKKSQCFVFKYTALPFGLSSSCKTFNDLVSALIGFWRRCPSGDGPTRASSYIDDVLSVNGSFDEVGSFMCYLLACSHACDESSPSGSALLVLSTLVCLCINPCSPCGCPS